MANKDKREQAWIDAKKNYWLSNATFQMAKELGLNPKKFGSLANHTQQPWKEPLPSFIRTLYKKRFPSASLEGDDDWL